MIKRVYIEITNQCNLKCSFCTASERTPSAMSCVQFSSVLPMIREVTDYIYLHVQGEPLLHPEFEEIMNICDRMQMQVQLVTNGVLISRYPGLLHHPSLRRISFSLQSVPFIPVKPELYIRRILDFCTEASRRGRPYCELRVWRSDRELPEILKQTVQTLTDRYPFDDSGRFDSYKIMEHVYVSFADSFTWPSPDGPFVSDTGTCRGGRDQVAVLADGTVVPCCLDCFGNIPLGNIFATPLDDILASPRYRELVSSFQNNRLSEDLCRHCSYRLRFNKG